MIKKTKTPDTIELDYHWIEPADEYLPECRMIWYVYPSPRRDWRDFYPPRSEPISLRPDDPLLAESAKRLGVTLRPKETNTKEKTDDQE